MSRVLVQLLDRGEVERHLDPVFVHRVFLPQRLLNGDGPVAEVLEVEDLGDLRVCILVLAVEVHDARDVGLGQHPALGPDGLTHLDPLRGAVDQLDLARPLLRLVVVQNPDIGRDAGVVEEVGG